MKKAFGCWCKQTTGRREGMMMILSFATDASNSGKVSLLFQALQLLLSQAVGMLFRRICAML